MSQWTGPLGAAIRESGGGAAPVPYFLPINQGSDVEATALQAELFQTFQILVGLNGLDGAIYQPGGQTQAPSCPEQVGGRGRGWGEAEAQSWSHPRMRLSMGACVWVHEGCPPQHLLLGEAGAGVTRAPHSQCHIRLLNN